MCSSQAAGIIDLLERLGEPAGEPTGDWELRLAPAMFQRERVRNVVIDNLQISSISLQLTVLTVPSFPTDAVRRPCVRWSDTGLGSSHRHLLEQRPSRHRLSVTRLSSFTLRPRDGLL